MKKLFYLILCLPLFFAACQPDNNDSKGENENLKLNLTSQRVMLFSADGAQSSIAYELVNDTRSAASGRVTATCDAEWISDIVVEDSVLFVVEPNLEDSREATIVVSYADQCFEVVVMQVASGGVALDANVLTGEYYGEYYTPTAGNYYISFSDNGYNEQGNRLPNSTYYQLDLYGVLYEGDAVDGCIPLSEGTYSLNKADTMVAGTISYSYSAYITTGADVNTASKSAFDALKLVVEPDGICILTANVKGVNHIVLFTGDSSIADKREVNSAGETKQMKAEYAYAYYYGDKYNPDVADNFILYLSDLGLDENGTECANGTYYRFDLYSELADKQNLTIPYGTYVIGGDYGEPLTIDKAYSLYYILDSAGTNYVAQAPPTAGVVTIDENGIVAELSIAGTKHVVTFDGVATIIDISTGGGNTGDGPLSTLAEDCVCDLSRHTLYYMYYGDYSNVGYMNWTFGIMPDDFKGDFVQFDVLAGPDSVDSFFGEYTISSSLGSYTAYPGYIDNSGYMAGSWYYTDDGITMAPFINGKMRVKDNGDDTVTVEFNTTDDKGNTVSGSWSGKMRPASDLMSLSLSTNSLIKF